MQQPIHRVGPNSGRDFWEAEFAASPGTVNVKRHSDHVEVLWHTPVNPVQLLETLQLFTSEYPDIWPNGILLDLDECQWELELDLNEYTETELSTLKNTEGVVPLSEAQDKVPVPEYLIRLLATSEEFVVLWTEHREPPHPIVDRGDERKPLPFHIAVRGPVEDPKTLNRLWDLYIAMGEPELSEDERVRLMEDVVQFINNPEKDDLS